MTWTYHAQDARTGAWITRNMPLADVQITDVLTGHGSMQATLAPEAAHPGPMEDWGVFIYAEKDGEIRFGGILAGSAVTDDGQAYDLDVVSFTAYAQGQPYVGTFRLWDADPMDCLREVWRAVQAQPRGNIGLSVDATRSPVRISPPKPPPLPRRKDVTYPAGSQWGTAGRSWPRPPRPKQLRTKRPKKRARRKGETAKHWAAYEADYAKRLERWKKKRNSATTSKAPEWNAWYRRLATLRRQWENTYGALEPYALSWWEQTDSGEELNRLAQEGGFEWRERHTWTANKAGVAHRLQLGYPSVGTTHTTPLTIARDLARHPEVTQAGDEFANLVYAVGAGEGRKMLRVSVGGDDGRLRRVATIARKNIRRRDRLTARAREEHRRRTLLRDIAEVVVWDDAGTLGDLRLGDVVPVQVASEWGSSTTRHKIIGRTYRPDEDEVLTLQLVRAERSNG